MTFEDFKAKYTKEIGEAVDRLFHEMRFSYQGTEAHNDALKRNQQQIEYIARARAIQGGNGGGPG